MFPQLRRFVCYKTNPILAVKRENTKCVLVLIYIHFSDHVGMVGSRHMQVDMYDKLTSQGALCNVKPVLWFELRSGKLELEYIN